VEAEIEQYDGHLVRAVTLLRDVHAFFLEQGDALNALPAAARLADLLLVAGEREEAGRLVETIEEQDTDEDRELRAAWLAVRAAIAAGAGDPAGAAELAAQALALVDATDFLLLQADVRTTLVAAATDAAAAERLRSEALERYDAKGAVALAAELRREPTAP
jgi:hypothetical protein